MMVPATEASIAMHCVQAQMRCIIRLSVRTPPLVNTFAIDAINPKANKRTDKLDASSNTYKIAVSSFSMDANCLIGESFQSLLPQFRRPVYGNDRTHSL